MRKKEKVEIKKEGKWRTDRARNDVATWLKKMSEEKKRKCMYGVV